MRLIKPASKELKKIFERSNRGRCRVEAQVRRIVEDVRRGGDEALIRYTEKFDGVRIPAVRLKVTESEINGAYQNIKPDFIQSLKAAIENVTLFHRKEQRFRSWRLKREDGVILGEKIVPLETVGVYVPAGTAPLVSTVYMTVLPARIAGVKKIVMVSPPDREGHINPQILAVAKLLKVDDIYKIGGAQAIAALAFGTKTIPKVDKIVGPGNQYVAEAKRQVFGYVDIDMIAGPSEVVIIANQFPQFVLSDLRAQGEHYQGLAILITPSKKLARQVKKEIEKGYVILVDNLNEAVKVANEIAPEHLQIMVRSPAKIIKLVRNAGAVFIGPYSPTAVGDYIAGPSHVLPTGGSARYFSGLGVDDFIRRMHLITYSRRALEKECPALEKIAGVEGLPQHHESVKSRLT